MDTFKLPIGTQDFPRLRSEGYVYIDKTRIVYDLLQGGNSYFLSRPRRMGKSLLLSLLEALFQGRRELFEGLEIEKTNYAFESYPVISLDFSRLSSSSPTALTSTLNDHLQCVAEDYQLGEIRQEEASQTLFQLVKLLSREKRVVLLIDEYDQPLIDHLGNKTLIAPHRAILNSFFSMIKSLGPHLQFVLVTGVSKFAKTSLFSGMNHLRDLSLHRNCATLLGITQHELDEQLGWALERVATMRGEAIDQTRDLMRKWYNGYLFSRSSAALRVYNPLSVMLFLEEGEIANYWFSTATPTFAMELIKRERYPVIAFETGVVAGSEIETSHEIDKIDVTVLLYQTGYLTIKAYDELTQSYLLQFPNEEVRRSFFDHLLHLFLDLPSSRSRPYLFQIEQALKEGNLASFVEEFNSLLTQIPHAIQMAREAYYHSLIYVMLRAIGMEVEAEVMTSRGRLDMGLVIGNKLYLFEPLIAT